ncbi:hypothetical protein [Clostridium cylindrosporum]|uniref:Uncharacterized protein n=1 Tax=Clostridium cylindrosporum DSM 605 TaxID=1121307 RepID=A0A0J8D9T3_CLOCY|nr:hypothetical protein [Clostridium cylindrosporum]KMT22597.1 hypothetical protein CLCY_9c00280 [Clostridium cylindrosporum DSM 605]
MILYEIFSKYTTSILSTISILIGSLVGSYCSWIIAKKTNCESIKEQYRILEENRKYDLYHRNKNIAISANIVRLDIANSIFQSIRFCSNYKEKREINYYSIPSTKDYSLHVASLSQKYSIKELSYIYQLYGIIDRLNYITIGYERYEESVIVDAYTSLLRKIYGDNYNIVIDLDDKQLSYKDLYNNNLILEGYKKVLSILDEICNIEEININIVSDDFER